MLQRKQLQLDEYPNWQGDVLSVKNISIKHLLIELNRFSEQEIIASGDIANLSVSGTFDLEDTDKNLLVLTTLHQLKAVQQQGHISLQSIHF